MRGTSIRLKLALWFSVILIVTVGLTFLAIRLASGVVLRGTIRDYLIGTVEKNVDKISYTETKKDAEANIYIPYGEGWLEIDEDFLDVVNDVRTALYTAEGTMLYGENPLARSTQELAFTESRTWSMKVERVRYDLYDRRLSLVLPDGERLWIRGVVPETRSAAQLDEITRLSLILLPLLIAFSVISGYFFTDKLLSPLGRIESAAGRISRGDDLKQRIETFRSKDEIGRLAEVFNSMLDRLEGSFEAERQFTSDASHELRTPTSVILAQCEYTLEKERTAEEYREALEVVFRQSRRMKTLIGDMLDYTRMDQRSERYPFEDIDLSEVVAETAEALAVPGENGITLAYGIEPGVRIFGNRLLLSRLVQNLISNAYRYGRENGHITVTLVKSGDGAELSVADDGVGIAKEEQQKIFDRFYRSDSSRSVQGTGLGLSMVKKIAGLHGASIGLESEPGVGSTFKINFPKISQL